MATPMVLHPQYLLSSIHGSLEQVQKVSSGSGRAGRLRLKGKYHRLRMVFLIYGKYIDHRLIARPEPDNTIWTVIAIFIMHRNFSYIPPAEVKSGRSYGSTHRGWLSIFLIPTKALAA